MGTGASCTLTLTIKRSGNYPAKTSSKTIQRKTYRVGQAGPGGGIIFYVDLTRAVGSQYFEAACAGWSDGTCGGSDLTDPEIVWCGYVTPISGADGRDIGTGEQNTTDIVAGCTTAVTAAKVAKALVLGGKSDWFLPSKDELNEMYIQRTAIGGFSPFNYWSSSAEFYRDTRYISSALYQGFDDLYGTQGSLGKNSSLRVRCVRYFQLRKTL
jgi:hypothetical protein